MKINLKIRAQNPVFWAQLVLSVLTPLTVYFGVAMQELTSWQTLGGLLLAALQNPFLLATVAVSVWNALNDPTTPGLKDSERARAYTELGG